MHYHCAVLISVLTKSHCALLICACQDLLCITSRLPGYLIVHYYIIVFTFSHCALLHVFTKISLCTSLVLTRTSLCTTYRALPGFHCALRSIVLTFGAHCALHFIVVTFAVFTLFGGDFTEGFPHNARQTQRRAAGETEGSLHPDSHLPLTSYSS